ncbi:MAG: helix-turn-helix domain-containing protein [Candidatus Aenigmarchaeota archaeon]|jgi:predicted transcriptional regulator|nr:helix-turn-helix domain-containing protein [Candidatus Aenigmarchaeota archaeon]
MESDKPLAYFLHVKPVKILTSLRSGPKYVTLIAKEVDITYSHAIKLLDIFNELGLVEFEEKGRIKMVKLTDSGEEIARLFDTLLSKLSRMKKIK